MWCCWIRFGGWLGERGVEGRGWEGGYDIHESVVMGLAVFSLWWCLIFEIVLSVLIALAGLMMCLNKFGRPTILSGSGTKITNADYMPEIPLSFHEATYRDINHLTSIPYSHPYTTTPFPQATFHITPPFPFPLPPSPLNPLHIRRRSTIRMNLHTHISPIPPPTPQDRNPQNSPSDPHTPPASDTHNSPN